MFLFAHELYSDVVAEAVILNAAHWIELYGKKGYRADHGGIVDLERANGFAYFTMRKDGELCGHAGFLIIKSPFYGKTIALDSFYYIKPEYRGAMGMTRLLKFAAKVLTNGGVSSVIASQKTDKDMSSMLNRAGYEKSGETFIYKGI